MQITPNTKRNLRLQSLLFYISFLLVMGLLAWLSQRYHWQIDLTSAGRNSLSEASVTLLDTLEAPVEIKAYARPTPALRKAISDLIGQYQRHKADIRLDFINPDTNPDEIRRQGVTYDGELQVSYQGRSEKLAQPSEQALTNALQRLARGEGQWVVFTSGHGERKPRGQANHDLATFVTEMETKGLKAQTINLAANPALPDNTALLVIAGPQARLLPGEVQLIRDYVNKGGNLLWLLDPEPLQGLVPLANDLGLSLIAGTVVDATTQLFGINDPTFALVAEYPQHPATRGLETLSLFPRAAGLRIQAPEGWTVTPLLSTLTRSWVETGTLEDSVGFDSTQGDVAGPVDIALSLTRSRDKAVPEEADGQTEQRVVVIGDGDFLSNAYLGNGGNLQLGLNLINWLVREDRLIAIPPRVQTDSELNLSRTASLAISLGFLIILPLALLGTGVGIWWRRRKY